MGIKGQPLGHTCTNRQEAGVAKCGANIGADCFGEGSEVTVFMITFLKSPSPCLLNAIFSNPAITVLLWLQKQSMLVNYPQPVHLYELKNAQLNAHYNNEPGYT